MKRLSLIAAAVASLASGQAMAAFAATNGQIVVMIADFTNSHSFEAILNAPTTVVSTGGVFTAADYAGQPAFAGTLPAASAFQSRGTDLKFDLGAALDAMTTNGATDDIRFGVFGENYPTKEYLATSTTTSTVTQLNGTANSAALKNSMQAGGFQPWSALFNINAAGATGANNTTSFLTTFNKNWAQNLKFTSMTALGNSLNFNYMKQTVPGYTVYGDAADGQIGTWTVSRTIDASGVSHTVAEWAVPVPEADTYAMLVAGGLFMAAVARRRIAA